MFWRTALHFTQFWAILALASGQLSDQQKNRIMDLHNFYRSLVNPQAANMHRLVWDTAISQVAANYAAKCRWDHNPNVMGTFGENLFMTLGPLTIDLPMKLWFDEFQDYNFETNSCAEGKKCGHYTQMIWANTSFIGCASNFCTSVQGSLEVNEAIILVCNYYPPGNIMRQSPYKEGAACATCPNGTTGCVNNACDRDSSITSGITSAIIDSMNGVGNLTHSTNGGNPAGFSAATLLLAALPAFITQMT